MSKNNGISPETLARILAGSLAATALTYPAAAYGAPAAQPAAEPAEEKTDEQKAVEQKALAKDWGDLSFYQDLDLLDGVIKDDCSEDTLTMVGIVSATNFYKSNYANYFKETQSKGFTIKEVVAGWNPGNQGMDYRKFIEDYYALDQSDQAAVKAFITKYHDYHELIAANLDFLSIYMARAVSVRMAYTVHDQLRITDWAHNGVLYQMAHEIENKEDFSILETAKFKGSQFTNDGSVLKLYYQIDDKTYIYEVDLTGVDTFIDSDGVEKYREGYESPCDGYIIYDRIYKGVLQIATDLCTRLTANNLTEKEISNFEKMYDLIVDSIDATSGEVKYKAGFNGKITTTDADGKEIEISTADYLIHTYAKAIEFLRDSNISLSYEINENLEYPNTTDPVMGDVEYTSDENIDTTGPAIMSGTGRGHFLDENVADLTEEQLEKLKEQKIVAYDPENKIVYIKLVWYSSAPRVGYETPDLFAQTRQDYLGYPITYADIANKALTAPEREAIAYLSQDAKNNGVYDIPEEYEPPVLKYTFNR